MHLEVVLWLTIILSLIAPIAMPNNLASVLTLHHLASWVKTSNSHVPGSSTPAYSQVEEEQIWEALETLNNHLGIRIVLELLLTQDLHTDLQHLVQLQHAIVHVLQIVEATALVVLQVSVDRQAEEEETLEQMREVMDDMVDAGHGVNDGEDFDFDGNDVDL